MILPRSWHDEFCPLPGPLCIGQVPSQARYLTLADNGDQTILTDSVDVDLYIDTGNGKDSEITSEFHAQARIAS